MDFPVQLKVTIQKLGYACKSAFYNISDEKLNNLLVEIQTSLDNEFNRYRKIFDGEYILPDNIPAIHTSEFLQDKIYVELCHLWRGHISDITPHTFCPGEIPRRAHTDVMSPWVAIRYP